MTLTLILSLRERKENTASALLVNYPAQSFGTTEISSELGDQVGSPFIRKPHGNFRSRFFKGQESRVLDLSDLRDMEAEVGTKWFAGFPDA